MKDFKQLLALFLCIVFCLSLFPSMAFAEGELGTDESAISTDPAEISDDVVEEDMPADDCSDAIVDGKDESFSENAIFEATGEGAFTATSKAAYTIDLPTYLVVPPTFADVSDETMLVDYTIEYQHTLRCILENYDIFWYFKPSTGPIGHISWCNEIDGIKYEYMLWIFDTNLTIDPYEQNGEIISTEHSPDGSWLETRYDFSGNVIIATYSPGGSQTYSWDAALQTWATYNSENDNTEYCDFDGLTPYHVPFCAVHFTGETLVLWDNGGSHGNTDSNGLVLDDDGVYRVYKDGVFDPVTGFTEYEGELFFVANGEIETSANGLVNDPDNTSVWYFCACGQVALSYSGLAEYGGEWFYLSNGVLDTSSVGIVNYNGGRFMIAAGRILRDVNGLIQDPNTGLWYYVAGGQVVDYTGLALYNGAWFYVIDGMLAVDYTGWVSYDGSDFYVVNGMVA